jgi:ferredoxin
MDGPLWTASEQVKAYQRCSGHHQAGARARGEADGAEVHSGSVKIVLDSDRCTGHGRCYSLAPELFDADDEGHSVVIATEVPAGLEAQARLAVDNCPETCISLEG